MCSAEWVDVTRSPSGRPATRRTVTATYAAHGVVVVGMGADGWTGLGETAKQALREAGTVIAGPRQLEQLPDWLGIRRVEWPSTRRSDIRDLVADHVDAGLVVLASGDPLHHGIGRTLVEELGIAHLHFLPNISSISLACARLGWSVEDVTVLNAVGGGLERLDECAQEDARVIVLSAGRDTPATVAAQLTRLGYGPSSLVVLGDLGGRDESRWEGEAQHWSAEITAGLNLVAFQGRRDPAARRTPARGGGRRPRRALALALLDPDPEDLVWLIGETDLSAGPGGLWPAPDEHPRCRQIDPTGLTAALSEDEAPDAVLLTGRTATPRAVESCRRALLPGGMLLAAGTTVEDSALLSRYHREMGGDLQRVTVATADTQDGSTRFGDGTELTLWRLHKAPEGA